MLDLRSGGDVEAAIFVDEVGLSTAACRDYQLKTAYRLIFRRAGDLLLPTAAQAEPACFHLGRAVRPDAFLATVRACERPFIDRLAASLAVRNLDCLDIAGLDLLLAFDTTTFPAEDFLRHPGGGLDPRRLICAPTQSDPQELAAALRRLRRAGLRSAVGLVETAALKALDPAPPAADLVRLPMRIARRVAGEPSATRLLATAVARLQDCGAAVFCDGISSPDDLAIAWSLRADLFGGPEFGPAKLAGADLAEEARPRRMGAAAQKVSPLRR